MEQLFEKIPRKLEAKGLLLKQGTIIDAVIINFSNRPLSDKKRKQLSQDPSAQMDADADTAKKNGIWFFWYKGHIGMDAGSKLIRKVCFSLASPHDNNFLAGLISENERELFGDKAFG